MQARHPHLGIYREHLKDVCVYVYYTRISALLYITRASVRPISV